MEVYNDEYMMISYDDKTQIMELTWKPTTEKMTDTLFREKNKPLFEQLLKYKPKAFISDNRGLLYTLSPETQKWVNEESKSVNSIAGCSKLSIVLSNDIFAQISMEQAMTEEIGFKIKYFNDLALARKWAGE